MVQEGHVESLLTLHQELRMTSQAPEVFCPGAKSLDEMAALLDEADKILDPGDTAEYRCSNGVVVRPFPIAGGT
jgi:hypothetical protein